MSVKAVCVGQKVEGCFLGFSSCIDSEERHAAIDDLEVRLVIEVQLTERAARDGFGEADNDIASDLTS